MQSLPRVHERNQSIVRCCRHDSTHRRFPFVQHVRRSQKKSLRTPFSPGFQRRRTRVSSVCKATSQPLSTSTGSIVRTQQREYRWGSYVSKNRKMEEAIDECVSQILQSIGENAEPELALVFVTSAIGKQLNKVIPKLRKRLPSLKHVFGTSGYGILGGGKLGPVEVEDKSAISLTLGCLPGVEITLKHTLRSGIPSEDASPDQWSAFLGVPPRPSRNLSLLMFSDSSFSHVDTICQGLDYAFPNAVKLGGVMSSGTGSRGRARAMFCWSADQQQQEAEQGKAEAAAEQPPSPVATAQADNGRVGGLLGGLFAGLASFGKPREAPQEEEPGALALSNGTEPAEDTSPEEVPSTDGVYMYGAVVAAIYGDIQIDVILSQGWRFLSDKTWTVVEVMEGSVLTKVREEGGRGDLLPPMYVVTEHLGEMVEANQLAESELPTTMGTLSIALAPAAGPLGRNDLELDDFVAVEMVGTDESTGFIELGCDVQPGQRFRIAVSDESGVKQDLRERMLAYKRRELGAMVSGRPQPPAFGALLFSDVTRGEELYGSTGGESGVVASYLPVPMSGTLLSSQFGWRDKLTEQYTGSSLVAVLRALPSAAQLQAPPSS